MDFQYSESNKGAPEMKEEATNFDSLVEYGKTYEVAQAVVVFNAGMYASQRPDEPRRKGKVIDPSCPDVEVEPEESKEIPMLPNSEIKKLMCTPRNKDGAITKDEMQNILNMILPPKVHTEEGRKWLTPVSNMPATRNDLIKIQDRLDMYLKQSRARETGLCPIRARFYSELFDELIRQVTIACLEQGLLLVRIRNESRMTIKEYENLFTSSTSCAIRKALFAETSKTSMEAKIENTLAKIERKKRCLEKLHKIYANVDKKNIQRFEAMKARHATQVANLKESNQTLKANLEAVILPRKAAAPTHD